MKSTVTAILIAGGIIAGAIIFTGGGSSSSSVDVVTAENVRVENGVQIVEITAKGGYQPRISLAKPNLPTILRFNTRGTFDCSASVRVPSLGISKFLTQTGSTDIDVGIQKSGTLQGSCGMGMYPFQVDFQD